MSTCILTNYNTYASYYKCGVVLKSPTTDSHDYALMCLYCQKVCAKYSTFLAHLEEHPLLPYDEQDESDEENEKETQKVEEEYLLTAHSVVKEEYIVTEEDSFYETRAIDIEVINTATENEAEEEYLDTENKNNHNLNVDDNYSETDTMDDDKHLLTKEHRNIEFCAEIEDEMLQNENIEVITKAKESKKLQLDGNENIDRISWKIKRKKPQVINTATENEAEEEYLDIEDKNDQDLNVDDNYRETDIIDDDKYLLTKQQPKIEVCAEIEEEVLQDENIEVITKAKKSKKIQLDGNDNIDRPSRKRKRKKPQSEDDEHNLSMTKAQSADENITTIIKIYQKCPCLWDDGDIYYNSERKKSETLEQMLQDLFNETQLQYSVAELQEQIDFIHKLVESEKKKIIEYELKYNRQDGYTSSSSLYDDIKYLLPYVGPFKCPYCLKIVKKVTQFRLHISRHENSKAYKCAACNFASSHKTDYIVHLRRHTQDFPFVCKQCGKAYPSKHELLRHMQNHKEIKKNIFCEVCGEGFTMQKLLNSHLKAHYNIRDNLCNVCGKGFTNSKLLSQHRTSVHSEEKRNVCKLCSKAYSGFRALSRHMAIKHNTTAAEVVSLWGEKPKNKTVLTLEEIENKRNSDSD